MKKKNKNLFYREIPLLNMLFEKIKPLHSGDLLKKVFFIVLFSFSGFLFLWVCFEVNTEVKTHFKIFPWIMGLLQKRLFFYIVGAFLGASSLFIKLFFFCDPFDLWYDVKTKSDLIFMRENRPSLGDASGSGSFSPEDGSDSRGRGKRPRELLEGRNLPSGSSASRPRILPRENAVPVPGIEALLDAAQVQEKYDRITSDTFSTASRLSRIKEWFPSGPNSNVPINQQEELNSLLEKIFDPSKESAFTLNLDHEIRYDASFRNHYENFEQKLQNYLVQKNVVCKLSEQNIHTMVYVCGKKLGTHPYQIIQGEYLADVYAEHIFEIMLKEYDKKYASGLFLFHQLRTDPVLNYNLEEIRSAINEIRAERRVPRKTRRLGISDTVDYFAHWSKTAGSEYNPREILCSGPLSKDFVRAIAEDVALR